MIEINVISVGSVKESYLQLLIDDYKKRISKYASIELITLKDESNKESEEIVKSIEAQRIIKAIKAGSFVILLDIYGTMLDSVEFAKKIDDITTYNSSSLTFIIGGSLGVNSQIKDIANYKISFSKMTFPHQLMKGILLEQIYRAFKILNNETYHK